MSWTEDNYSEPQDDWGQSADNENGFGQGAQKNLVSWGWAHIRSWGHAITNLLGKLATLPTDGLEWSAFLPDQFNSFSVNSGAGLDFIGVNGDYLEFSNIITFTSDWEVSFSSSSPSLSNLFGNNSNDRVQARPDGVLRVRVSGVTYDLSGYILNDASYLYTINVSGGIISLYRDSELTDSLPISNTNFNIRYISRYSNTYDDNVFYFFKYTNGETNTFNFLESNGATIYPTEYATTGITGTINGATWITGSPYGEQLYQWGYNTYNTSGVLDPLGTVNITGEIRESETDILGNTILRKAVGLVDNAPVASNHYRQIEAVTGDTFDTSGDYSLGMVLQVPSGTDGGTALTNGSMVVTIDEVNVTFTRDNSTILTYPHNNANAMFFCWVSQANGTTDLWVGDSDTEPVKVITGGAAGLATAGTIPLRTNNNNALTDRMNGYDALANGYNRLLTDQEILDIYIFISGGIPSTSGFPLEFPITLT